MKFILLFMVMLFVHFPAAAQDTPRAELFLGYSALVTPSETTVVTDVADNIRLKRETSFINGWNASLSVNVNSWLGFVGDFSGQLWTDRLQRPDLGQQPHLRIKRTNPSLPGRTAFCGRARIFKSLPPRTDWGRQLPRVRHGKRDKP
ncbi:MAG: hypothetical protein EBZ36_05895 [Acidobacteria bacterium]|nr:hypothetical protein [Acidobacteriota bacterium]